MNKYSKEINTIYELLLAKDNSNYEAYRSELIKRYSYVTFKYILKQASYKINKTPYQLVNF